MQFDNQYVFIVNVFSKNKIVSSVKNIFKQDKCYSVTLLLVKIKKLFFWTKKSKMKILCMRKDSNHHPLPSKRNFWQYTKAGKAKIMDIMLKYNNKVEKGLKG